MIYVFLGNEFNIINKKIDEIILSSNISNIIKYDYENSSIIDVLDEVNYIDLFNERKLIILSSFSFKKMKEKEEKELLKYLDHLSENIIVIKCIDDTLDKRKKIVNALIEKCKVETVEKLDYKNLETFITKIFSDNKKKISSSNIKKILYNSQYNTDFAINEVDKLLLYKLNSDEITDDDIEKVCSKNPEKEIFRLGDYVIKKDIKNIIESYKILVDSGVDATLIIDSLANQYRLLYQTKVLSKSKSPIQISKELGVLPFQVNKMIESIGNYKESDIIELLYKLSLLDIQIKIESKDKNKILENFLLSI